MHVLLKSIGIDLAGKGSGKTGFAVMNEDLICKTKILYTDHEIIRSTVNEKPDIVCIDAPLFLPEGKKSFRQRGPPHLRKCDKILLKMGIKFFPITLGPMRLLTMRGIKIKRELEKNDILVFESFPGAVQDILGIPRKQRGLEMLLKGLTCLGISIDAKENLDDDQLDAATLSLVGMMYLWGYAKKIGKEGEGYMLIPEL